MTFKPKANGMPGEIRENEHGYGGTVTLTDRIVIPVVQHDDGTFGPIS